MAYLIWKKLQVKQTAKNKVMKDYLIAFET